METSQGGSRFLESVDSLNPFSQSELAAQSQAFLKGVRAVFPKCIGRLPYTRLPLSCSWDELPLAEHSPAWATGSF